MSKDGRKSSFSEFWTSLRASRSAYLDEHTDDPDVRREVEELLAHADDGSLERSGGRSERVFEVFAGELASTPEVDLPKVLGDFEINRELGRGGVGIVYEARQVSPSRRRSLPAAVSLGLGPTMSSWTDS